MYNYYENQSKLCDHVIQITSDICGFRAARFLCGPWFETHSFNSVAGGGGVEIRRQQIEDIMSDVSNTTETSTLGIG